MNPMRIFQKKPTPQETLEQLVERSIQLRDELIEGLTKAATMPIGIEWDYEPIDVVFSVLEELNVRGFEPRKLDRDKIHGVDGAGDPRVVKLEDMELQDLIALVRCKHYSI